MERILPILPMIILLAGWESALSNAQALSPAQDISFTARCDGTEQRYALMFPEGFKNEELHDLLVVFHGHGSDRWQYIKENRDECHAARDFAAERRMLYVSPDYRASTSWMGPKAEDDVIQILDDLKRSYRVSRVFLCGASMGGAASLTFACLHPDLVDGVASMNGTANFLEFENFQEAITESFGGTKATLPEEYKKRSAEYWPERFTMPVGLVVSGQDTVVPPQSVQRLAGALRAIHGTVSLIFREELGHLAEYSDTKSALEFAVNNARPRGWGRHGTEDPPAPTGIR